MSKLDILNDFSGSGLRLFPLQPQDKKPILKGGYKVATTDKKTIANWNKKYPTANWGFATGDIIVIDVDTKNGGEIPDFCQKSTLIITTGNKGYHLYYDNHQKIDIRNSAGKIAKGVDVRGYGGYVAIPPSTLGQGKEYFVSNNSKISSLPDDLSRILQASGKNEKFPKQETKNHIVEGERNSELFRYACFLRGKACSEDQILKALSERNRDCVPPLGWGELENIARGAAKYEPNNQNTLEIPRNLQATLTDTGNAERFAKLYGNEHRYCPNWGEWIAWNGQYWKTEIKENIRTYGMDTAHSIYFEAANTADTLMIKQLGDWAKISLSASKIFSMVELAKPLLSLSQELLDKNPYFINLNNGIYDLQNGEFLSHHPDYYLTKIAKVNFDPKAKCDKWLEFLDIVLPDKNDQKFIQKSVGYSMTGLTDAQCLFLLYGSGANGKTTFINTISQLLGDYSQHSDIEALLDTNKGGGANPYVARLFKARFVACNEIPDGKRFNEKLIKVLTGSDKLIARKLYQEPFEFEPTHKLWLVGNYLPKVMDMSHGFWRRIMVIPFKISIPKEKQRDMSIINKEFQQEFPGIFNWAVDGYRLWKEEGLNPPEGVKKASECYREDHVVDP